MSNLHYPGGNGRPAPVGNHEGFILSDRPLVGYGEAGGGGDVAMLRILGALLGPNVVPKAMASSNDSNKRRCRAKIVRELVPEENGEGYCDIVYFNEYHYVLIFRVKYQNDRWLEIPGGRHCRFRLLLSGQIVDGVGNILAKGPQGHFAVSTSEETSGYFVKGGQELKMVVLGFYGSVLDTLLGLERSDVPAPFNRLFDSGGGELVSASFDLTSELASSTQKIIDVHHNMPVQLRVPAIEMMSLETLLAILGDFLNRERVGMSTSNLNARDLNHIYEARDYLSEHYMEPITIRALARMVGINQTKLKAGFKQTFGVTLHDYILECRMKRASELLLAKDRSIAEISYEVGYEYPANFTSAFKKHYGTLPREWKRTASGAVSQH